MSQDVGGEVATTRPRATVERTSDREMVVTRAVNGPARLVFEAWTRPELFERWWVPRSLPMSLVSCEMDVRVGGGYRLVLGYEGSTMAFFGRYLEVAPPSRLVWTNDEQHGGGTVTTLTLEERGATTLVTVHDLYPSKEALDEAIASGSTSGMPEQLDQLDGLLPTLVASPSGA